MTDFDKQMEMVLYHSDEGDVSVDAYIADESIWVSQKGMSEIFGVDKSGISRHLKKIFETGELDEKVVVAKIATTTRHGAIEGKIQQNIVLTIPEIQKLLINFTRQFKTSFIMQLRNILQLKLYMNLQITPKIIWA